MSGSGKSTIVEELKYGIIKKEENTVSLSFELEMSALDQAIRYSSRVLLKTRQELFDEGSELVKADNSFVIDTKVSIQEFVDMSSNFIDDNVGKNVIITLDHILLLNDNRGDKIKIDDFYNNLISLKRKYESLGRNVL